MISVIIPHYNQPEHLLRCLASLVGQKPHGHDVEIIVVDNGSESMPEAEVAAYPGVILDKETTPGPGPARNHGVLLSKGEILAFIDADCVADDGWLEAIAARFGSDPQAVILGGDVQILHEDPARPTAIEAFEAEFGYRMEHYIKRNNYTGTGNLAIRREVFLDVGDFIGMGVAEDRDWGLRAFAKGYRTMWEPNMLAFHPARGNFAELARKWDRHVAHEFEAILKRRFGRLRWILRTLVVAASPVGQVPRVMRSKRILGGLRARLLALVALVRIRLYRVGLMIPLIFARDAMGLANRWRAKE
ncbi:MAG: glycosyltransferase [Albidovulum sp.]